MTDGLVIRHMSNGRALWGTHALWAYVLNAWMKKNTDPNTEPAEWGGIEFDKLANLVQLIWNEFAGRDPQGDSASVSFFSAYQSADGVHGPGPALPANGSLTRHIPLLDTLSMLQGSLKEITPDALMFRLGTREFAGRKQYKVHLGRERTWLPYHLSDTLTPAWEPRDKKHADMLAELISGLTQDEIRALGTHQTKSGTIKALEYNVFIHLFWRYIEETEFIEKRGHVVRKGKRRGSSDLPSLIYVIDEIGRKSRTNQVPYRSGLEKLQKAAKQRYAMAEIPLQRIYESADSIWVKQITDWENVGKRLQCLHSYLIALRNIFLPGEPPVDMAEMSAWEEKRKIENEECGKAISQIRTWYGVKLPPMPESLRASYDWGGLRGAIVAIFDTLPGETEYHRKYQEAAMRYRT